MKHVKSFDELNETVGDLPKSMIWIDNSISKLRKDKTGGTLYLGPVSEMSGIYIENLKKTHKDCTIEIKDGKYYLKVK